MLARATREAYLRASMVLLIVASTASCEGRPPPPPRADPTDEGQPLVGGSCTYEPFEFRAVVDSSLSDGALLVRPQGMVPTGGRCHLLQDAGDGRWRLLAQSGRAPPARGDTITVSGEVITLGTCTPCSLGYQLASAAAGSRGP